MNQMLVHKTQTVAKQATFKKDEAKMKKAKQTRDNGNRYSDLMIRRKQKESPYNVINNLSN